MKLTYQAAGRETMAAIEQELEGPTLSTAEAPMIEISEAPAGRETMAAIEAELAESLGRPRQNTLPYADRIANAPGARSPSRAPKVPSRPAPKPSSRPAAQQVDPPTLRKEASPEQLEIFELLTFIVRGNQAGDLTTDAARRRFVEAHLLRRVPGNSLDAVERIEVTPWTAKGTMVVRVWCRA